MKGAVLHVVLSLLFMSVSSCRTNMTSSGRRQSPININTRRVHRIDSGRNGLSITYQYPPNSTIRVYKDNYTVYFAPETPSDDFYVSGGPLGEHKYIFSQLHFHWGENDSEGSEHTVNNRRYSMEAHLVCTKQENATAAARTTNPNNIAVMGLFIDAGNVPNPSFENVTEIINRSAASDVLFFVRAAEAYTWFIRCLKKGFKYYTYPGSLTTPPFTENVQWNVFDKECGISSAQIEPFRRLFFRGTPLTPNFREIQPLNSRRVCSSRLQELRTR